MLGIIPTISYLSGSETNNVRLKRENIESRMTLSYKNDKFYQYNNWHFSKGVNPCFWSKNGHFYKLFFLGNIGEENVFFDILERKNTFIDYKNKEFEKSKN